MTDQTVTVEMTVAEARLWLQAPRFPSDLHERIEAALPPAIVERLHATFGHLTGVGLDLPGPVKA